jgi:uncharacterized protein YcgL (UPF0745 family)
MLPEAVLVLMADPCYCSCEATFYLYLEITYIFISISRAYSSSPPTPYLVYALLYYYARVMSNADPELMINRYIHMSGYYITHPQQIEALQKDQYHSHLKHQYTQSSPATSSCTSFPLWDSSN